MTLKPPAERISRLGLLLAWGPLICVPIAVQLLAPRAIDTPIPDRYWDLIRPIGTGIALLSILGALVGFRHALRAPARHCALSWPFVCSGLAALAMLAIANIFYVA